MTTLLLIDIHKHHLAYYDGVCLLQQPDYMHIDAFNEKWEYTSVIRLQSSLMEQ